jgi:hypothetical protein
MRLRHHINEKKPNKAEQARIDDFNDIYAPLIEKNCGEILKVYRLQQEWLHRGVHDKGDFIEKTMRTGVRKPAATNKKTHIRLNKLMKERFGWKVRDGISTATKHHQTLIYGEAYIFFPFNKYKFCYSPTTYDLFREIKDQPIGMPDKEWEPIIMRNLTKLVKKHQDTNLDGAWERSGEVLFKVKKYYLLKYSDYQLLAQERWMW